MQLGFEKLSTATLPRRLVFALGALVTGIAALKAFGGWSTLWSFTDHPVHKFVARRMLEGHLYLIRNMHDLVGHDLQLHDGAVFTNFGYGVPLLQLPFHWLAPYLKGNPDYLFFPDRPIFMGYLLATIAFQLYAWRRALAARFAETHPRWLPLAPAALTLASLAYGLFPLLGYRFIVYEETLAYLYLSQLVALAAYLLYIASGRMRWVLVAGAAAGFGTVIRPTGLLLCLAWVAVFALRRRSWRIGAAVAAAAMPSLLLWIFFNWTRTGTLLSPGYENSLPAYPFQYSVVRFGAPCTRDWRGVLDVAKSLLAVCFIGTPSLTPGLRACAFQVEIPPGFSAPLLGWGLGMTWAGLMPYLLYRWRERAEMLPPYLAVAAVLAGFVYAGIGFTYRYAGDLQPMLLLTGAQWLLLAPGARRPWVLPALVLALPLLWLGKHPPVSPRLVNAHAWPTLVKFYRGLDSKKNDARLADSIACSDRPSGLYSDHLGWETDCRIVIPTTNHYLGIPPKTGGDYRLSLEAIGKLPDRLRVYVNGRRYWARREGSLWQAELPLDRARFHSPNLAVSVEWTREMVLSSRIKLLRLALN